MRADERVFFDEVDSFMTLRHVKLHGTNVEIGQWLGQLAIERYGKSPEQFAANSLYAKARRLYFQRNYPIHWERVRGVAVAFGLDPEDDRYDFTGLPHLTELPVPPVGCSAIYYPPATTASGHGYLSRNFDFFVGSMADVMQVPLSPVVKEQLSPVMSEPYLMEWYPEDGGYASLAIHAFDTLAGTLDGINSAGLVVSILADNEAFNELGPKLEPHPWPMQVIGLHELAVMRLLLDTCATVSEAKEALLTIKQHYRFIPCHYIVADRSGQSFIYENSTGRNVQHVIAGNGQPQVVTNFQLYKHPIPESMPSGKLTLESESFWRYRLLADRIVNHHDGFTAEEMKANNACVNVMEVIKTTSPDDPLREVPGRTVWHSLYDQHADTLEVSFYLGEEAHADGTRKEHRSEYLKFSLEA